MLKRKFLFMALSIFVLSLGSNIITYATEIDTIEQYENIDDVTEGQYIEPIVEFIRNLIWQYGPQVDAYLRNFQPSPIPLGDKIKILKNNLDDFLSYLESIGIDVPFYEQYHL